MSKAKEPKTEPEAADPNDGFFRTLLVEVNELVDAAKTAADDGSDLSKMNVAAKMMSAMSPLLKIAGAQSEEDKKKKLLKVPAWFAEGLNESARSLAMAGIFLAVGELLKGE